MFSCFSDSLLGLLQMLFVCLQVFAVFLLVIICHHGVWWSALFFS